MKRNRSLLILVTVLIMLSGVYALVSLHPASGSDTDISTDKIQLSVIDAGKIVKMTLSSKGGTIELDKDGDIWEYKADPNINISQDAVSSIATSFANIYADRVVDENPADLEQYGLKSPEAYAAAVLDDGSRIEISIGSKAPSSGAYYMMLKGDLKLYLLPSADGDHFRYTLSDIRNKAVVSIQPDSINQINIVSSGREMEFRRIPGDTEELREIGYTSWVISKPYSREYPADAYAVQELANSIAGVTASGFVDDNPSDYSKYGLDKPAMEISVLAGGSRLELYIGGSGEDGGVYFRTGDSKTVYTMDKDSADAFGKAAFTYVDKYVYSVSIDSVNQIVIENQGARDVLDITRTAKPASGDDESQETVETFKLNGKEVDSDKAKGFYQNLIGLAIDAESEKKVDESPEVRITFVLNKDTVKQEIIGFSPYNSDFYALFRGGKCDFLISKSQVQGILNNMDDLKS